VPSSCVCPFLSSDVGSGGGGGGGVVVGGRLVSPLLVFLFSHTVSKLAVVAPPLVSLLEPFGRYELLLDWFTEDMFICAAISSSSSSVTGLGR